MKHDWMEKQFIGKPMTCCKNCGIVRKLDGSNDEKECKGVVHVGLRDDKQPG